jgi:hypothetical protein
MVFNATFNSISVISWQLIKGVKYTSELFSYGPNKAFLVPDSSTQTERNGNRISADVTENY